MFKKFRSYFHDDWCPNCTETMEVLKKQLYQLPVTVDHYASPKDSSYFLKNLRIVTRKADIPVGFYACGAYVYRCPKCGEKRVKLSVFLPVREQEKIEDTLFYKEDAIINFIMNN